MPQSIHIQDRRMAQYTTDLFSYVFSLAQWMCFITVLLGLLRCGERSTRWPCPATSRPMRQPSGCFVHCLRILDSGGITRDPDDVLYTQCPPGYKPSGFRLESPSGLLDSRMNSGLEPTANLRHLATLRSPASEA